MESEEGIYDSETNQKYEDELLGLESKIRAMSEIKSLTSKLKAAVSNLERIPLLEKRFKNYKLCCNFESAADDLLEVFRIQKELQISSRSNLILDVG